LKGSILWIEPFLFHKTIPAVETYTDYVSERCIMTFIIFDLEWVATFYKGQMPEVISIGAVKLREDNGRLVKVGQYDAYVRPLKAKALNKRTIKMTGIRPQDVSTKEDFPKAWKRFVKWFGEEEYYLLTWGTEDVRTLIRNCKQHRMTLEWLRNYNDLQAEFGRIHELKNQLGLIHALEMLTLEPVGKHHSAVDDARNTAEIFKACYERLNLQKNHHVQVQRKHGPKKNPRRVSKPNPQAAATAGKPPAPRNRPLGRTPRSVNV
jgi:inhibitor of KinA sporulation pathway (predicted exonuclease)